MFDRKVTSDEYKQMLISAGPLFDKNASFDVKRFTQQKFTRILGEKFNEDGSFPLKFAMLEVFLKERCVWSSTKKHNFAI